MNSKALESKFQEIKRGEQRHTENTLIRSSGLIEVQATHRNKNSEMKSKFNVK